jgi:hypothetical protein
LQTIIKRRETNCNSIKTQITILKDSQDQDFEILEWLSSHDIRGSYKSVLERTKIGKEYSARCQWLIDHDAFEKWYTPGKDSVLWLKGTIGTGKTTLMARAITEMKQSALIEEDKMPLAIFFFQQASGSSPAILSVEACLRSLARQLSWTTGSSAPRKSTPQLKQNTANLKFRTASAAL